MCRFFHANCDADCMKVAKLKPSPFTFQVLIEGEKDTRPQRSDVCEISIEGKLQDGTVIEKCDKLVLSAMEGEVRYCL